MTQILRPKSSRSSFPKRSDETRGSMNNFHRKPMRYYKPRMRSSRVASRSLGPCPGNLTMASKYLRCGRRRLRVILQHDQGMKVWRIKIFSYFRPPWHKPIQQEPLLLKTLTPWTKSIWIKANREGIHRLRTFPSLALGLVYLDRSASPLRPRISKAWRCQISGCHKLGSNKIYWDLRQGGNQSKHVHVFSTALN